MEDFKLLQKLINELNISNSTLDKLNTLSKEEYNNAFIKDILLYTYDPFRQYYITPDNLKKRKELTSNTNRFSSIFDLLNELSSRKITGHQAISDTNYFIEQHSDYSNIIYDILDRNLKTRVSEKLINKVFTDLIPTFEVALANKYDEKQASKIDFEKEAYYASRKLDGLRCLCVIKKHDDIKFYSRSGNEFLTLDVLKEEVLKLNLENVVLDGEICIIQEQIDDNSNTEKEDFQSILKEYNKKNHTIKNPKYKIFDFISFNDFSKGFSKQILSERQKFLKIALQNYNGKHLNVLEQWKIESKEHLELLKQEAIKYNWEGLMIRKDCFYEGKRSNNLLKYKIFSDGEYIVKSINTGPFRVINKGIEVTEELMSNVIIEHKGFEVSVGSGFSIEQRRFYKNNPTAIIGKQITVMYFEETQNQNGEISLRFPTVKAIYENIRNV